jgi:ankyrin repeat protein
MDLFEIIADGSRHPEKVVQNVLEYPGLAAEVNTKPTWWGRTPIFSVLEYSNQVVAAEVAEILLSHGAHVESGADHHLLFEAITAGQEPLLRKLMARGHDINTKIKGFAPFYLLPCRDLGIEAFNERLDMVARLGGDIFQKADDGTTLLHHAIFGGISLKFISSLLDRGIDINHADNYGWTALHMAVAGGWKDAIRLLLQRGADRYAAIKDRHGYDIGGSGKTKPGMLPIDLARACHKDYPLPDDVVEMLEV